MITVGEFASRLFGLLKKPLELSDLLRFGHFRGWLEDSDEAHPEAALNRQTAARITHEFMRIELNIPDLADISPAAKLKDLYTCRVCANHIAQLYCRGIMDAKKEEPDSTDSSVLFFNHLALLSQDQALAIISKLEELL